MERTKQIKFIVTMVEKHMASDTTDCSMDDTIEKIKVKLNPIIASGDIDENVANETLAIIFPDWDVAKEKDRLIQKLSNEKKALNSKITSLKNNIESLKKDLHSTESRCSYLSSCVSSSNGRC